MEITKKFRKYGGEGIPDIVEYIDDYLSDNPTCTVSLGCDSQERRRGIVYAITVMFYDHNIRDGAHVVFNRMTIKGKMDIFTRLYKESEIIYELAEHIENSIGDKYERQDLSDNNIKKYKLHLEQYKGKYVFIDGWEEDIILKSINVTNKDRVIQYKLCDIHLDYNIDFGFGQNKSHNVFKSAVPWFKSSGYRVWCKPCSAASSTAADMLLK